MYAPGPFRVEDQREVAGIIARYPFATLVASGPDGPVAARTPMLADLDEQGRVRGLLGHIARANPFWRVADGAEVLALFSGAHAYVSPGAYRTKAETGRAVPTWNYTAAEVRGRLAVTTDRDALYEIVDRLSAAMEAGQVQPWDIRDAPADYIDRLLNGIVGLSMENASAEAVRKLSQNKSKDDVEGVMAALSASRDANARQTAADMAQLPRG
ncbi:FMN-binding negative transcriptional regulator [Marinicauda algicola]|uniref:FMN-binding negative transcriptional regulator n=1 Tax=Marinicauda algicola TaxID=2029849 RepID=A0A4S2GWT2_9PROT|nr:FMN-binding negative transcriptional regulator [Marinicauda algicola]TGY87202.1 FMN-binding negative transcriptional regulator [Marinicauda algicola]